jgi:hypothetical protein
MLTRRKIGAAPAKTGETKAPETAKGEEPSLGSVAILRPMTRDVREIPPKCIRMVKVFVTTLPFGGRAGRRRCKRYLSLASTSARIALSSS